MKILYIGSLVPHSNSLRRAKTLERLGHQLKPLDIESKLVGTGLRDVFHYRTGYRFLQRNVLSTLQREIGSNTFDIVFVNGGAVLGANSLGFLKSHSRCVLNYNNDDPTGPRDWCRWHTFRAALPYYDLCIVMRETNIGEYQQYGARQVCRMPMDFDDVDLSTVVEEPGERQRWASDVLFVGTWMPERGPLILELLRRGVPVSVYGNRWQKDPNWTALKGSFRGEALHGSDYVRAIRNAGICLGLLSKGNRDLHTTRSFEVPFIGSLLLAERTAEHMQFFLEDREAVFWTTPAECSSKCIQLLTDKPRRDAIVEAGRKKVIALKVSQRESLERILDLAAAKGAYRKI